MPERRRAHEGAELADDGECACSLAGRYCSLALPLTLALPLVQTMFAKQYCTARARAEADADAASTTAPLRWSNKPWYYECGVELPAAQKATFPAADVTLAVAVTGFPTTTDE